MLNKLFKIVAILTGLSLAGCSQYYSRMSSSPAQETKNVYSESDALGQQASVEHPGVVADSTIGGYIASNMNKANRSKLTHALDKPIGKSSHWVDESTGTSYTLVPTQRLSITGRNFCRRYTLTAERNGATSQYNGTACVAADSSWQEV